MNNLSPLQQAITEVRIQIVAALATARARTGELAAAMQAELAQTSSVYVRAKLEAGDVLEASNSAFASSFLTDTVHRTFGELLTPVIDQLELELRPVLWGERQMQARVSSGRHSHLPKKCIELGYIPATATRDLISYALCDALVLTQWVLQQSNVEASTAIGFVHYAAGASNFVNRTGLFDDRVRVDTTDDGRPVYDYTWARTPSLHVDDDESGSSPIAVHDQVTASEYHETLHNTDQLETLLLELIEAHLGQPANRAFMPLFEHLCQKPRVDLRRERTLLRRSSRVTGLPQKDVELTADALMTVVETLRHNTIRAQGGEA